MTKNVLKPDNIVASSHVGLIRERNEDSYAYCCMPQGPNAFIAVADGIGGHEGGDLASRTCVKELLLNWRRAGLDSSRSVPKVTKFLKRGIYEANERIYKFNSDSESLHPMGTTLVAGVFVRGSLVVAHSGDSRCYRLRGGVLEQLTEDHSFVSQLVKEKVILPEEAKFHPFSHIISQSVGPTPEIEPEINVFGRNPEDRFLFCTDGLTGHLDDVEIEMEMQNAETPAEAVKKLLYGTLRSGGEDNITILCVFT